MADKQKPYSNYEEMRRKAEQGKAMRELQRKMNRTATVGQLVGIERMMLKCMEMADCAMMQAALNGIAARRGWLRRLLRRRPSMDEMRAEINRIHEVRDRLLREEEEKGQKKDVPPAKPEPPPMSIIKGTMQPKPL